MDYFTVTENTTIKQYEAYKSSLPSEIAVFLLIWNILLSITASLGNAVILVALHKETTLHPPTKLLCRCLAITDLCVGVVIHPVMVLFYSFSVTTVVSWKMFHYVDMLRRSLSFVLCQVSILTSCAISVDRLLALLSGLRYRHVVTLPRIRAIITCFWLIGILVASINLWSTGIAFTVCFVEVVFALTTSAFSYGKIFRKLRNQLQVHAVPQGLTNGRQSPLNIARYKRSVTSAISVQLALFTCCIPYLVVRVMMFALYVKITVNKFEVAVEITATVLYFNSTLNTFLYCWRIRSVRQAAKDTIKQLTCCK